MGGWEGGAFIVGLDESQRIVNLVIGYRGEGVCIPVHLFK
jgi:hypothetical protein